MPRCKKPCPGCKRPDQYRDADGLCRDCEQLMRDGRSFGKIKERLSTRSDRVNVLVPQAPHWLPYLGAGDDDFQAAFRDLAILIGEPVRTRDTDDDGMSVSSGPYVTTDVWLTGSRNRDTTTFSCDVYALRPEVNEALNRLWAGAATLRDETRTRAFSDGQNLLVGLAEGRYTAQEFNERNDVVKKEL